jgi:hypothetical protein
MEVREQVYKANHPKMSLKLSVYDSVNGSTDKRCKVGAEVLGWYICCLTIYVRACTHYNVHYSSQIHSRTGPPAFVAWRASTTTPMPELTLSTQSGTYEFGYS